MNTNTNNKNLIKKALHVYYAADSIAAKIASSMVYEYISRYRKDICIYKFHKVSTTNIVFNDVKKNDIVAVINCKAFKSSLYEDVAELSKTNDLIWVDGEIDIDKILYIDSKINPNAICAFSYNCESIVLNLYEQLLMVLHRESVYRRSINMINNYLINIDVKKDEIEFMQGMMYKNFSAKNFFKFLYNGHDVDIFDKDELDRDIEAINNTIMLAKNNNLNINMRDTDIEDLITFNISMPNNITYTCAALNTTNEYPLKHKLNEYNIVCAFYRDKTYWNYKFYFNINATKSIEAISKALNNKVFSDIRYMKDNYILMVSETCIFDKDISEIIIKKKLPFSSKQKVTVIYSSGGNKE